MATLRALRGLLAVDLDDVGVANLAQRAGREYANAEHGIVDEMAAILDDQRHMLFIDARGLVYRLQSMPADSELIVIDLGVPRTLAASKCNERRTECAQAARMLGVAKLRDVVDPALVEPLPEPYRRRARHVVRENQRVLEPANGVGVARLGALMNASHASLRDDDEVSIPELDELAAFLRDTPAVAGARLTGWESGGAWGGVVPRRQRAGGAAAALVRYNATKRQGRILIPAPAA